MIMIKKELLLAITIALSFFLISLLTLSDYGISWDEPIHFHRGQAYLHYFFTGESEFKTLGERPSFFQSNSLPGSYFFKEDSGHPPLNGILAAFTNFVFYQQLGVMGDIESHHLFNILCASFLVFIVVLFATENFGLFAGLVAGLSLSLYPLFFAEAKFNIKDPPEAAFFGLTIYTFWRALNSWSWKWLIGSAVAFGFGLGTKFNILFIPFIVFPWAIFKILYFDKGKIKITRRFLIAILSSPIIISVIFIGTWPFLWDNTISNLLEIFGYYKQIGSGYNHQTNQYYLPLGINSYPLIWIVYTTPPYILFLSIIGIFAALINFKHKQGVTILWLFWLMIPIARVIAPNTSIYGGIRQIMEYIPAMALIAGLGAFSIREFFNHLFPKLNRNLLNLFLLLGFFQIVLVLIKIHPHQNVYFNQLIGGLSGAKAAEIPSWGNSFGNAYKPMVDWLNQNAPTSAKIALIQGTALNIPKIMFRQDLIFNNQTWSGMNRQGEYMIELTHQNPVKAYPYAWDYIERVLEPVYEVKVDGVAIAKIWKNDLDNSKSQFKKEESEFEFKIEDKSDEKSLVLTLNRPIHLSRVIITYPPENCDKPIGTVALSSDGVNFTLEPDPYPSEFTTEPNKRPNVIYQYFAVPIGSHIKFIDKSSNSCIFKFSDIVVKGFE